MKTATRTSPPAAQARAATASAAAKQGTKQNTGSSKSSFTGRLRRVGVRLLCWAVCLAVAITQVWLLSKIGGEAQLIAVTFPAAVTAALLREHRFTTTAWRRWVIVWLIPLVTLEEYRLPIFLIATTWALHQMWVVERTTPWSDVIGLPAQDAAANSKTAKGGTAKGGTAKGGTAKDGTAKEGPSGASRGHKSSQPTTKGVTKNGATRRAKTTSKAGSR